jgi:hypothetical protein
MVRSSVRFTRRDLKTQGSALKLQIVTLEQVADARHDGKAVALTEVRPGKLADLWTSLE